MLLKRIFAVTGIFIATLLVVSQSLLLNAAPLPQDATPTPQAEEEPMAAEATAEPMEESVEEPVEEPEENTTAVMDEPTLAGLAEQVAVLQAQLAKVQATAQRNGVNMAVYLMDQAGLHALDARLNEEGVIEDGDSSTVGRLARLLSTVDWPMDMAADAESLTMVLTDLAAALEEEDVEAGASLATQAHEEQHALSHSVEAWLSGGHGEHGEHGDAAGSHDHGDAPAMAVTDVDGLLIENVLANLALPSATGSVWLKITNTTSEDEALTGAEIPGCGVIELHDMKMENDVMVMFQVEGGEIAIPAGETVTLQRGGLHIMCINKEAPVAVGTEVEITLQFANAGDVVVTAPVVEPGMSMEMEHDHGEESEDDAASE